MRPAARQVENFNPLLGPPISRKKADGRLSTAADGDDDRDRYALLRLREPRQVGLVLGVDCAHADPIAIAFAPQVEVALVGRPSSVPCIICMSPCEFKSREPLSGSEPLPPRQPVSEAELVQRLPHQVLADADAVFTMQLCSDERGTRPWEPRFESRNANAESVS